MPRILPTPDIKRPAALCQQTSPEKTQCLFYHSNITTPSILTPVLHLCAPEKNLTATTPDIAHLNAERHDMQGILPAGSIDPAAPVAPAPVSRGVCTEPHSAAIGNLSEKRAAKTGEHEGILATVRSRCCGPAGVIDEKP